MLKKTILYNNTLNEKPRMRQDRQKLTFHGLDYPKETHNSAIAPHITEAVHHQQVLLGSSIHVIDH